MVQNPPVAVAGHQPGKRVAWVELYLDLVFVLAVAQLAHLIVAEPERHSVWVALGLFATLWCFAERFGLFLIILLGEVVVEAGQASVAEHVHTAGGWAALVAAMLLAGVVLVATFQLARLDLEPYAYVWLLAVWTLLCAVLTTRWSRESEDATSSWMASADRGAPQSSSDAGAGRL